MIFYYFFVFPVTRYSQIVSSVEGQLSLYWVPQSAGCMWENLNFCGTCETKVKFNLVKLVPPPENISDNLVEVSIPAVIIPVVYNYKMHLQLSDRI